MLMRTSSNRSKAANSYFVILCIHFVNDFQSHLHFEQIWREFVRTPFLSPPHTHENESFKAIKKYNAAPPPDYSSL